MLTRMSEDFVSFFANPVQPSRCKCGATIDHPGYCDRCVRRWEAGREVQQFEAVLESIPPHFRKAKFGSEELARFATPAAATAAKAKLDGLLSRATSELVLIGPRGAGKTSLACACLRESVDRRHPLALRARFVSCVELGASRRDSPLGHRPYLLDDAITASLLVLDELGKGIDQEPIVEVVAARHDAERPTIVTTPWSQERLEMLPNGGLDGGTLRRIFEHASVLQMGPRIP